MSICTSFHQIYTKFPLSLPSANTQIFKTLVLDSPPISISKNRLFSGPITIERISTKPIASSSSSLSLSSLQPIEELPPELQKIINLFQSVENTKAKSDQVMFYAKNLTPLNPKFKTIEYKVQRCNSQVWVRAYLESDGNCVVYEADSDSIIGKGIAALLVKGLSGQPVDEILRVSPDFIVLLGLGYNSIPSRNNRFLNILTSMQQKALQLYLEKEKNSALGGENLVL